MTERTCTIEGCEQPAGSGSRGWCRKHYQRWWRNGDPTLVLKRGRGRKYRFLDAAEKQCPRCKQVLPLESFNKNRASRDGRSTYCPPCMTIVSRESRNRHREKYLARHKTYREANTEERNDIARDWYRAHPERGRATAKAWAAANPAAYNANIVRRRLRMKANTMFHVTERDVRRAMAMGCSVPGCTAKADTLDHIIPVARGGSHGIGNLQAMCRSHNASKGRKLWIEFRVYLSKH